MQRDKTKKPLRKRLREINDFKTWVRFSKKNPR